MDDRAFEEAIGPHYEGLVRRLTLVLHDSEEAQDVAQDAYLRAYRARARFDGVDARAWLHTIGLRLAFNRRRGLRRGLAGLGRQAATSPVEPWIPETRVDLWHALGELRTEHRAAILLNVLDGYTQAEIASILGAPPGTVASWIASGKARLRSLLEGAAP